MVRHTAALLFGAIAIALLAARCTPQIPLPPPEGQPGHPASAADAGDREPIMDAGAAPSGDVQPGDAVLLGTPPPLQQPGGPVAPAAGAAERPDEPELR